MGFVDIFADQASPGYCRQALGDQHRRGSCRVQGEKGLPPLPCALLHQPQIEAVFADDETDESRMRAERMMVQREHAGLVVFRSLTKRLVLRLSRMGPGGRQTRA